MKDIFFRWIALAAILSIAIKQYLFAADCSENDRYGYWGEGKSSYYRII